METDQILLRKFIEQHPFQAVEILETLDDEQVSSLIEAIPIDLGIQLISSMHRDTGARCLPMLNKDRALELLEKTGESVAVALLGSSDEQFRQEMLDQLAVDRVTVLLRRLEYPKDSIGTIMHPVHLALRRDMTIELALRLLKKNQDKITERVYVIDEENKFVGAVLLSKLLFGNENDRISTLLETESPKVNAEGSIQSVKNHPGWQKYRTLPVIESSEKLAGILYFADIHAVQTQGSDEKTRHVLETSTALGELYRIGLQGLLHSISEIR